MSKIEYPEEFKIFLTNREEINRDIYHFRTQNPNYEIFNISVAGTGGQYRKAYEFHYHVIWRKKN